MQICRWKLQYMWQKVHHTNPCVNLGPHKSKPKLELYALNLPPTLPPLATNLAHCIISKPLQNIPNLILIKPTQYLYPKQLLCHFLNHIIPQIFLPIPNPFNSRKKSQMGGIPVKKFIL